MPAATLTEPVESTPEISYVAEPRNEEYQPETDPVHEHNEDTHIVEKQEIPEEAEASSSLDHEILPTETVDDVPPEPSPPSDLGGPTGEEYSAPVEHIVEDPIGEAKERYVDEIEPPEERTNESPDETPFEPHHEQSAEDDTQQSVEPDLEKSVPEEHTHELVHEPVMQEPLEVENIPHETEEHPVDEASQESAIEVVDQDEEHREQTSEEAVEQESSPAEQSEEPISHESIEHAEEQPILTADEESNEEEQVNPLEDLEEIPQTPAAAQPEEHLDREEEPAVESTTHQGDETPANKSVEEHEPSVNDVDNTNNVPEIDHLDEPTNENISSEVGQDEIGGLTEETMEVHFPEDTHETAETHVTDAPEEPSTDVPITDSFDEQLTDNTTNQRPPLDEHPQDEEIPEPPADELTGQTESTSHSNEGEVMDSLNNPSTNSLRRNRLPYSFPKMKWRMLLSLRLSLHLSKMTSTTRPKRVLPKRLRMTKQPGKMFHLSMSVRRVPQRK